MQLLNSFCCLPRLVVAHNKLCYVGRFRLDVYDVLEGRNCLINVVISFSLPPHFMIINWLIIHSLLLATFSFPPPPFRSLERSQIYNGITQRITRVSRISIISFAGSSTADVKARSLDMTRREAIAWNRNHRAINNCITVECSLCLECMLRKYRLASIPSIRHHNFPIVQCFLSLLVLLSSHELIKYVIGFVPK